VGVYCFLSRRGGDSEELITGWPKTSNQSQFLVALQGAGIRVGAVVSSMRILKDGFASGLGIG
jgi:hypothetical protein